MSPLVLAVALFAPAAEARSTVVSVSGAAFQVEGPGQMRVYSNGMATNTDNGSGYAFHASVSLPHGARITHMACTLYDEDPHGSVAVSLVRHATTTGGLDFTGDTIATAQTSDTGFTTQERELGAVDASVARVNNTNYAYTFSAQFTGGVGVGFLGVQSCMVRLTL